MWSKFKVGQRVKVNFGKSGGVHFGTVSRIQYCFGYIYIVNIDSIGAKQVNHIMIESL